MPRQSPPIAVEEHPGEAFADLGAAQRAALRPIVADLASTLRAMLAAGILAVRDGQIVKANRKEEPKDE